MMTETTPIDLSLSRCRWVGYGLLLLALIDAVQVLIPLQILNPNWQLQTIGALVDRAVIPLLGLVLVFYGEMYARLRWEARVVKALSWLCLLLTLLFLLLLPLTVWATARLDALNELTLNGQLAQQLAQVEQTEGQLKQDNQQVLQALAAKLNSTGAALETKEPQTLKTTLLARLSTARSQLQVQSQESRASQKLTLFKNAIRLNLTELVLSTLFFVLWQSTRWSRAMGARSPHAVPSSLPTES